MRQKHKIGFFGAVALALGMTMGAADQANALKFPNQQTAPGGQRQNKKEAIPERQNVIVPQSTRNDWGGFSGDRNPFRHHRKGDRNQRQYRKWLRQNPHMRRYA